MKQRFILIMTLLLATSLAACSNNTAKETDNASAPTSVTEVEGQAEPVVVEAATEQTITYLGESYTLPAQVNNIVAASLESMEDAAILGIKPIGVLSIADAIPTYLEKDLAGAALVGDKRTPSNEAILALDPDVILGSSKFGAEVSEALNKIQTTIPYSHISTNWKDNLILFGQLSGKQSEAAAIIAEYDAKAAEAKLKVGESLKDKEILVLRIRSGILNAYPAGVYLNPIIYEDLGATVPALITKAEAQADVSMEALADANPDFLFIQFETSENTDATTALEDITNNPIFKSIKAAKNNHVFVNVIDPLAQGGTGWSKVKFLDAAIENLLE